MGGKEPCPLLVGISTGVATCRSLKKLILEQPYGPVCSYLSHSKSSFPKITYISLLMTILFPIARKWDLDLNSQMNGQWKAIHIHNVIFCNLKKKKWNHDSCIKLEVTGNNSVSLRNSREFQGPAWSSVQGKCLPLSWSPGTWVCFLHRSMPSTHPSLAHTASSQRNLCETNE